MIIAVALIPMMVSVQGLDALMASDSYQDDTPAVADWPCADNLIEKNFDQKLPAAKLAARIEMECAKPIDESDPDNVTTVDRALYNVDRSIFADEIEEKIEQRRFKQSVQLRR
jgi:hypothetical protein